MVVHDSWKVTEMKKSIIVCKISYILLDLKFLNGICLKAVGFDFVEYKATAVLTKNSTIKIIWSLAIRTSIVPSLRKSAKTSEYVKFCSFHDLNFEYPMKPR